MLCNFIALKIVRGSFLARKDACYIASHALSTLASYECQAYGNTTAGKDGTLEILCPLLAFVVLTMALLHWNIWAQMSSHFIALKILWAPFLNRKFAHCAATYTPSALSSSKYQFDIN